MADQVDNNKGVGKDVDLASRLPNVISIPEINTAKAPSAEKHGGKIVVPEVIPESESTSTKSETSSAGDPAKPLSKANATPVRPIFIADNATPRSVSAASDADNLPTTDASSSENVSTEIFSSSEEFTPDADERLETELVTSAEAESQSETDAEVEVDSQPEIDAKAEIEDELEVAADDLDEFVSELEEAHDTVSEFKVDPSRPSVKDSGRRGKSKAKQPTRSSSSKKTNQRRRPIVIGVIVFLLIVILGVSWGRWLRCDDTQDIQGQWFSSATTGTAVVNIDSKTIRLASDVAYSYTLDTTAKTIQYDFGTMHGQGRYWFSDDRTTLVIVDGTDFTAASTFFDDVLLWWRGVFASITGDDKPILQGENSVSLTRTNQNTAQAATTSSSSNAGMSAGAQNDEEKVAQTQQNTQQSQSAQTSNQTSNQTSGQQQTSDQSTNQQSADQQQSASQ